MKPYFNYITKETSQHELGVLENTFLFILLTSQGNDAALVTLLKTAHSLIHGKKSSSEAIDSKLYGSKWKGMRPSTHRERERHACTHAISV